MSVSWSGLQILCIHTGIQACIRAQTDSDKTFWTAKEVKRGWNQCFFSWRSRLNKHKHSHTRAHTNKHTCTLTLWLGDPLRSQCHWPKRKKEVEKGSTEWLMTIPSTSYCSAEQQRPTMVEIHSSIQPLFVWKIYRLKLQHEKPTGSLLLWIN